jgi:hypothetical protein
VILLPNTYDLDEKELTEQLLQKFYIDRDARIQYEEEVVRSYKQYVAYVKELSDQEKEKIGHRSRLNIPKTYQQVDTFRARALKALFNTSPYVDFVPKASKGSDPESMLANEEKAKIPAALVNSQLEKNNIVEVGWDFFTSMAIAKAGILSVGWRYKKRTVKKRKKFTELEPGQKVEVLSKNVKELLKGKPQNMVWEEVVEEEEVVWDDNEIQNVDWFDFWPDARGRNYNPDTWRHCWRRDWMTRDQIESHLEKMKEFGATVYDISEEEWLELSNRNDALQEGRQQRLGAVGKTYDIRDSAADSKLDKDKDSILYECLFYHTGEDLGLIISQYKLAAYGPTPYYRHKKIPFIFQPYDPLPNEIQGRSFCDWLYHLQEELNTNRNQRVDCRALIINPMWTTTDDDMPDVIISRPGKVLKSHAQGALTPQPVNDTTVVSVQEEQIIHQDMENTMGTPAIAMGVDSQRDQTATEITTKNSNASARFDVRINLYQLAIRRLCYLMDMNNQQFITDNRLVQIADEEGIKKWREISPDDIGGEWDYIPAGVNVDPYANKELRRQQFMQMIDLAAKLGLPWDKEIISDDLLNTFDIRNAQKYKLSPEKIQEQNQAAMMQQQQQQQAMQQEMQMKVQMDLTKQIVGVLGDVVKEAAKSNPVLLGQLLGSLGGMQNLQPQQPIDQATQQDNFL